jgi:c-di-GMP-binding flagellar brake protein YcgR
VQNKRKEQRFKEKNKVLIQYALDCKNANGYLGINAKTYDISLSGVRIATKQAFPIDTILRIQISLSKSDQVVTLDGKIKWVKKAKKRDTVEMGVEFLHEISKTVLSLIRHLYGEDVGIPSKISC